MSNLIQKIENCFLDALRQGNLVKANRIISATKGKTYDSIKKMIENEHYILRNLRTFLSDTDEAKLVKIASSECGLKEATESYYDEGEDGGVEDTSLEITDTSQGPSEDEEEGDIEPDEELLPEGNLVFFFDKSDKTLRKLNPTHLYDVWCFFDENIVPIIEKMGYEIMWFPEMTKKEKEEGVSEPATLFKVTLVDEEQNRRASFSVPMADVWKVDSFQTKKYVSQLMKELSWEARDKKKVKKIRRSDG